MAERTAKAQAEIPYSLLEYTAVFKKPIMFAWTPEVIVAAVLDTLEPWGFRLDGVEFKAPEKLSEYAIVFRRSVPAAPGLSLTLRLDRFVVAAENLDWSEKDQFIAEMTAARNAIVQKGKAEIQSQQLSLGMHIQLKTKPRKDVTTPLINPVAFKILDGEVTFPGIFLQQDKSGIIIDASVAYANGLFVRMWREHPPEVTFGRLAEVLHKDEERLFDILGLEGIL